MTSVETLLPRLRAATGRMVDDLAALVGCESPSDDLAATAACADVLTKLTADLFPSAPEVIERGGRKHLCWRGGGPTKVLIVGHLDTVWPLGTLARWPFTVDRDRATGPGIFDMKTGLVQTFHALSTLDDLTGVTVLVTSDEELGSPSSRSLIEEEAAGARAAFVTEASAGGALKIVRKGVSLYRVVVRGHAAHAGLEPERGINATVELAHQILAASAIADPEQGTTVTPTVCRGGVTTNTVPERAELTCDVRAATPAEQARVDAAFHALRPTQPGARVEVEGGPNRPPLDASSSAALFAAAQRLADGIGIGPIDGVAVGGASDGNFTAGVGIPTLDGLGAVGDLAHAEGEWVSIAAMPERAALLAALVAAVQAGEA
ncbi:M20/M25/M40 family metallo-hydrolase [Pseudonocardia sp. TRM90224]|uniref:M20/M25/M40 family metallo-hydrolase n=1 Tax=Pseudonocardia sp. TRM90224 TaxID=2812678 RepID=UPI001E40A271|nr:M20/M25/M40 family metallo-hydrolase [Pseudonocardia sp. TRM90224]